MIVVVETNFILELVLRQLQSEACEEILCLCSTTERFRLVIPAFAVSEAGMKIERRHGERKKFVRQDIEAQARESRRSKLLQRFESVIADLKREMLAAEDEESSRWLEFRASLSPCAKVIALTGAMLNKALSISSVEMCPSSPMH